MSERDTRKVLALLDDPPEPNERLVSLLKARQAR
ncbi:DUF1778 domain-containing protein [Roseateles sp.]